MADSEVAPVVTTVPRGKRWRKRLAIAALILVGAFVLLILLTPWLVNALVRPRLVAAMADRLNVPVTIERTSFSWFSGLDIEGVRIGNVAGGASGDAFTLARVSGDINLFPLLGGRVVLGKDVVIDSPRLRLVMQADGSTNLDHLLAGMDQPAAAPAPADPNVPSTLPHVVGKVKVKNLEVVVVDARGTELTVPTLNVALAVDTFAKPVHAEVASADGAFTLVTDLQIAKDGVLAIDQMTGTVAYHLDPAFSVAMRPLLALAPMISESDLTVSGDGDIAIAGLTSLSGKGGLTIAMNHAVLTMPGAAGAAPVVYTIAPGTVELRFTAQTAAGGNVDAKVALTAPFAKAEMAMAGTMTAEGQKLTATLTTALDLGELGKRFPGIIGDPRLGALVGTVEGSVTGACATLAGHASGEAAISLAGTGIGERKANGTVVPLLDAPKIAGSVSFDSAAGRYTVKNGSVHLTGLDLAIEADATLAKPDPSRAAGQDLAATLSGLTGMSATASLRADFTAVMATMRRLVPVLPAEWDVSGSLTSDLAIAGDPAKPDVFSLKTQLKADNLRLRGFPPLTDIDLAPTVTVALAGELNAKQGRLVIPQAVITSTPCSIDASGTAIDGVFTAMPVAHLTLAVSGKPWSISNIVRPLLNGFQVGGDAFTLHLEGKASADGGDLRCSLALPRLDVVMPAVDGVDNPQIIKEGKDLKKVNGKVVTLGEGSVAMKIFGSHAWSRMRVDGLAVAAKLLSGKGITDAITMNAESIAADISANAYRASGFAITLPGTVVNFSGGVADSVIEPIFLSVTGELAPLLACGKRLGVGLPISGEGALSLSAKGSGTLDKLHLHDVAVAVKQVSLSGMDLDTSVVWPISAALTIDLHCSPLRLIESPLLLETLHVQAPGLEVRGEKGSLVVGDLLAGLDHLFDPTVKVANNSAVALQLVATVNPSQVMALLPSMAGQKDIAIAADAVASATVSLEGTAHAPQLNLAATLPPLRFIMPAKPGDSKPGEKIDLKQSTITFTTAIDVTKGTITADKLALITDLANAEGSGSATLVRSPAGGIAALQAKLAGKADLNRLVGLGTAMGMMPAGTTLSGDRLEWKVDASTTGGDIPLALTLTIPNCLYRDATMSLPKQDVRLDLRGTLKDQGKALVIDPASRLTATTIQAGLRGTIHDLFGKPSADLLVIDLTVTPKEINPLLGALGGGTLNGSAAETSRLELSGPLMPSADPLAWLKLLDTHDSRVAFGSVTHSGFTIVGPPLPLRLAQGKLDLDYTCTVNGGATGLKVAASLPAEHADLRVNTTNLHLTNDLAWLVAYVNPIFHLEEQGTLKGNASFAMTGAWHGPFMPVDVRKALGTSLEASGRFSATKVAITGSKLLVAIINGVSGGAAGDLVEVSPTDFTIHKGVVSYKAMPVRVGDMTLTFSGTANLVTDALDMTLVAPLSSSLAGTKAGKYLPKTLTLPIRGTISKPVYDFTGAVKAAAKEAATKAAKEELKDQAGGLLDGLLKKKL